jgi:hypothetical protein
MQDCQIICSRFSKNPCNNNDIGKFASCAVSPSNERPEDVGGVNAMHQWQAEGACIFAQQKSRRF